MGLQSTEWIIKVQKNSRISLPKPFAEEMGIREKDHLAIFKISGEQDGFFLRKVTVEV